MKKKTLYLLSSILVTTFLLPIIAVNLIPADAGMAVCFLLLLGVYPVQSLLIGYFAGSELRRLWWAVLCMPVATPLLFSLSFFEMIWELWFYSPIYLAAGLAGMAVSVIFGYISARKKRQG